MLQWWTTVIQHTNKISKEKKTIFKILRKSYSGVVNSRLLRHNVLKYGKCWILNGLGVALINELLIQIYSLALNISWIYRSRCPTGHHPKPLDHSNQAYSNGTMNRLEIQAGTFNHVKGLNELFKSIRICIWIKLSFDKLVINLLLTPTLFISFVSFRCFEQFYNFHFHYSQHLLNVAYKLLMNR